MADIKALVGKKIVSIENDAGYFKLSLDDGEVFFIMGDYGGEVYFESESERREKEQRYEKITHQALSNPWYHIAESHRIGPALKTLEFGPTLGEQISRSIVVVPENDDLWVQYSYNNKKFSIPAVDWEEHVSQVKDTKVREILLGYKEKAEKAFNYFANLKNSP